MLRRHQRATNPVSAARYLSAWDTAVRSAEGELLHQSRAGRRFLGSRSHPHELEQFTCFMPGLMSLRQKMMEEQEGGGAEGSLLAQAGAQAAQGQGRAEALGKQQQAQVADELMESCWQMWTDQPTGLAPECADMVCACAGRQSII